MCLLKVWNQTWRKSQLLHFQVFWNELFLFFLFFFFFSYQCAEQAQLHSTEKKNNTYLMREYIDDEKMFIS